MLYRYDEKILRGKKAIVTGGSRGIGRAIAIALAESGANVAIIYNGSADAAQETVKIMEQTGAKAKAYQCDVSDFGKVKEVVEQINAYFGGIDILVNNAGITADKPLALMGEDDFDRVIDINLKGAFNFIRHVCPVMARKRSGKIINISSVSGIMGNPAQANYAASKAGLTGLAKTVAKEYAARNITCNVIAPGFIKTDMTQKLSDTIKERVTGAIPLGRMGEPEDVASMAVFLASPYADYITGQVIKIDGGLCI